MRETTQADRRQELQSLLEQIRQHPELDWAEERERARVLSEMLAESQAPA